MQYNAIQCNLLWCDPAELCGEIWTEAGSLGKVDFIGIRSFWWEGLVEPAEWLWNCKNITYESSIQDHHWFICFTLRLCWLCHSVTTSAPVSLSLIVITRGGGVKPSLGRKHLIYQVLKSFPFLSHLIWMTNWIGVLYICTCSYALQWDCWCWPHCRTIATSPVLGGDLAMNPPGGESLKIKPTLWRIIQNSIQQWWFDF